MTSRDDMVITPRLEPARAAAPTRAREERRSAGTRKRGGVMHKLVKARAAKRAARLRRARHSARGAGIARRGLGGMARGAATRAAAATPIGLIVTAAVVAAAVVTRLATGQSFENLGQQVNNMLLGDLDDTARASATTRRQITGDRDLARIIGQEGKVNSQIASIHKDLMMLNKRDEVGRTLIQSETGMQHNGIFDMLILRAKKKFEEVWNSTGGPHSVEKFHGKYRGVLLSAGKGAR